MPVGVCTYMQRPKVDANCFLQLLFIFLKYVRSVCHVCEGALSTLKRVSLEVGRWGAQPLSRLLGQ